MDHDLSSTSISAPVAAPRLLIVVLPFAKLSNDPDQQYFADGITEDLTTDLSRISGSLVISRNTAFSYALDAQFQRNQLVSDKPDLTSLGDG